MVRFHMVDNKVIYLPVTNLFPYFLKELLLKILLHRVNQGNLFIYNQI